jgi:hypothetical protein
VPLISIAEGTAALVHLLNEPSSISQYVIGDPLPFPAKPISTETKQYQIRRKLTLEQNPFLIDHVIAGNAVLPTVCAISWFINSCEALYPGLQFFRIRDYTVYKGIVFDSVDPGDYSLSLNVMDMAKDSVSIEGRISSENEEGKSRNHYNCVIDLTRIVPQQPRITDFDLHDSGDYSSQDLYEQKILFHGPRFRGVNRILNISSAGITTECLLPIIERKDMGQFPVRNFNPYLADVHLQSLLIWAHIQKGSIGLPLKIAEGNQYQQVPFDQPSYATMRVVSSTAHKLIADVISHDQDGFVYSEVKGAEITMNARLYELFQDNHLKREPQWI